MVCVFFVRSVDRVFEIRSMSAGEGTKHELNKSRSLLILNNHNSHPESTLSGVGRCPAFAHATYQILETLPLQTHLGSCLSISGFQIWCLFRGCRTQMYQQLSIRWWTIPPSYIYIYIHILCVYICVYIYICTYVYNTHIDTYTYTDICIYRYVYCR